MLTCALCSSRATWMDQQAVEIGLGPCVSLPTLLAVNLVSLLTVGMTATDSGVRESCWWWSGTTLLRRCAISMFAGRRDGTQVKHAILLNAQLAACCPLVYFCCLARATESLCISTLDFPRLVNLIITRLGIYNLICLLVISHDNSFLYSCGRSGPP